MNDDPFHLNRPVHLARRDAFYDKAVAHIKKLSVNKDITDQRKTAKQALYLLREARNHAEAANLSEKTSTQNRLFPDFMDTVIDNTQSIIHMLHWQAVVETKDNPLSRFLGSADTGAKRAEHYHRCAMKILKGLLVILQQAEKPFRDLRQTSLAKMTFEDKARYEKAAQHFEKLADHEAEKAIETLISNT